MTRLDNIRGLGLWEEYLHRRRQLIAGGMSPGAAKDRALAEVEELAAGQTGGVQVITAAQVIPAAGQSASEQEPVPGVVNEPVEMRKAVEWAFANMGANVSREDEPTPGAYEFLQWAKKNDANKEKFYTNYVSKLLPPKSVQDSENESFKDDGRKVLGVIDKLKA